MSWGHKGVAILDHRAILLFFKAVYKAPLPIVMFLTPLPTVYSFHNLFVLQEYVLMLITQHVSKPLTS